MPNTTHIDIEIRSARDLLAFADKLRARNDIDQIPVCTVHDDPVAFIVLEDGLEGRGKIVRVQIGPRA